MQAYLVACPESQAPCHLCMAAWKEVGSVARGLGHSGHDGRVGTALA